MKTLARFFIFLAQSFILIVLIILLFNSFLLKPLFSSSLGLYWDTDVSMRRVEIDWFLPGIVFQDMKVGNPYGFPRGNMLEIEHVVMRFDKSHGFLSEGVLKPMSLELRVKRVNLLRRISGHLNLQVFVDPENYHKKNGLGFAPAETRIFIEEVIETDVTTPILKKQDYILQDKEFIIGGKSNFRTVAKIAVKELFKRIGLNEEGKAPVLPAPQYYGITSAIEQEIREHAEQAAKKEAAETEFEALSTEEDQQIS